MIKSFLPTISQDNNILPKSKKWCVYLDEKGTLIRGLKFISHKCFQALPGCLRLYQNSEQYNYYDFSFVQLVHVFKELNAKFLMVGSSSAICNQYYNPCIRTRVKIQGVILKSSLFGQGVLIGEDKV